MHAYFFFHFQNHQKESSFTIISSIMKKLSILLVGLITFWACDSDVERRLSTDLQVEGTELFNISLAFEESLYFALLTLEDYRVAQRDSLSLPGCPKLTVDLEASQVQLTFEANPACESRKLDRKGTIVIDFVRNTLTESRKVLSYENYSFKNLTLNGERTFLTARNGSPNSIMENFESVQLTNARGSSSRISGTFSHQLQLSNRQLIGFTSIGQLTGINTVGRNFSMEQTTPRQYSVSCLRAGHILSQQGVERWTISRGQNSPAVNHTMVFEFVETCVGRANLALSDGRVLVFSL